MKEKIRKNWRTILLILAVSIIAGTAQMITNQLVAQNKQEITQNTQTGSVEITGYKYYANGTLVFSVKNNYPTQIRITQVEVLTGESSVREDNKTTFINPVKKSDSNPKTVNSKEQAFYFLNNLPSKETGEEYDAETTVIYNFKGVTKEKRTTLSGKVDG